MPIQNHDGSLLLNGRTEYPQILLLVLVHWQLFATIAKYFQLLPTSVPNITNYCCRYFVLVILLIRGATLPGAYEGILFYVYPTAEKMRGLGDIQVREGPGLWISQVSSPFTFKPSS